MIEFGPDVEIRKISSEASEFFENVLHDEEPAFVSEEATILDVSMAPANEVMERCARFYGKPFLVEDLKQPLWKLIRPLKGGRK